MKHILLTISLIFSATAVSAASSQSKDAFKILEDGVIIHSTEIFGETDYEKYDTIIHSTMKTNYAFALLFLD